MIVNNFGAQMFLRVSKVVISWTCVYLRPVITVRIFNSFTTLWSQKKMIILIELSIETKMKTTIIYYL